MIINKPKYNIGDLIIESDNQCWTIISREKYNSLFLRSDFKYKCSLVSSIASKQCLKEFKEIDIIIGIFKNCLKYKCCKNGI